MQEDIKPAPMPRRRMIEAPQKRPKRWHTFNKKRLLPPFIALIVIICGFALWHAYANRPVVDPFDAKTLASAQFPLYYPTKLPAGYKIEKKSLNVPQAGVVVFNLIGPKKQKIYISQEARPSKFDFGGYYNNFSDLKQTVVANGTIAVGRINNGQTEIGSLATQKSWVLTNTAAKIPLGQLADMLNSLALSH